MRFLKPIAIVTLWIVVSFVWVSIGQSKERDCLKTGTVESWLKPYSTLSNWYRFYTGRNVCITSESNFFKTLASSETLSIKMNQAGITFDQFYVPLYHLMTVDWEGLKESKGENIQSDLTLLEQSLRKITAPMSDDNRQYFQEMVLLDLPSEFAQLTSPEATISKNSLVPPTYL